MNCIALSCHMLHSDIEYPVFKQFHMDLQLPNVCLSVDLLIFMCVFLYYHRSIWDVSHSWGNDFTQTPWTDAHNSMQNNETSFRSDSIRNTLNDTHTHGTSMRRQKDREISRSFSCYSNDIEWRANGSNSHMSLNYSWKSEPK